VTRIRSHMIQNVPGAPRPLLDQVIQFSPTGRLLNLAAPAPAPAGRE
jgi:hypothetical protein